VQEIVFACKTNSLSVPQEWGREGIRIHCEKPFRLALVHGASSDILRCLVKDLGADVNLRNSIGLTPLYAASYVGDQEKVRLLLEELGADVNIANTSDCVPLWIATSKGHLGIVRILLASKADSNHRSGEDMTPLSVAASKKHHEIATWLVKAGADT
jgi:ankyrin repeat protein